MSCRCHLAGLVKQDQEPGKASTVRTVECGATDYHFDCHREDPARDVSSMQET